MSMLLSCDNKGCYRQDYHKLDVKTGEVMCLACEQPIKSITKITKGLLKSSRQIIIEKRSENELTCEACGGRAPPLLRRLTDVSYSVHCSSCDEKSVHQSKYFGHTWIGREGVVVKDCRAEHAKARAEKLAELATQQEMARDKEVDGQFADVVVKPPRPTGPPPPSLGDQLYEAFED